MAEDVFNFHQANIEFIDLGLFCIT